MYQQPISDNKNQHVFIFLRIHPSQPRMPVSTRIIIRFVGGILINLNLHLPLNGEWIQDVLPGFSKSKRNFRHAFSILHLWKKTISSRSIVSHDIDTLDFSGQRGCHSLTCKIGHIPKKDKGASTASKHFKGYTRLYWYYISRKSLDTRTSQWYQKVVGAPQNLGSKEKKTTDIWMFPKTGVSPNHPFY